jgi:hypothetical protein
MVHLFKPPPSATAQPPATEPPPVHRSHRLRVHYAGYLIITEFDDGEHIVDRWLHLPKQSGLAPEDFTGRLLSTGRSFEINISPDSRTFDYLVDLASEDVQAFLDAVVPTIQPAHTL